MENREKSVTTIKVGPDQLSVRKNESNTLELLKQLAKKECRSMAKEMQFLVEKRAQELGIEVKA